jgi:predicted Zn-dependent protease
MHRSLCIAFAVLLAAWATLLRAETTLAAQNTPPAGAQEHAPEAASVEDARRLIRTGHAEQALHTLDGLAKINPSTPGLDRARGSAFYALERLTDADAAFEVALALDPHDLESAQMRGLTLFRLGRPADAIPLLEKAPGNGVQTKADPSYVLALCYMDTRRYDDARHAFAAQYGFPPDAPAAYLLAARMLFRREYLPVAQRFVETALQLDPNLPLANELLGEISLTHNQFDDAAKYFDKERVRNPLEPSAYERLGDAYSRAGRYPEARQVLQEAILLEPNSTGPYILLGRVTLKEGDAVAALTFLQKAVRMDPSNFMTHNLLAQTYRALGRTADASRELELTQKIQSADQPHLSAPQ